MSVHSDGSYGIDEGIVFSYPVSCKDGEYEIVQGLELDELSVSRLKASENELLGERKIIADLLP
jgi:malate dehydrogenase